jgi:hypothetical protein
MEKGRPNFFQQRGITPGQLEKMIDQYFEFGGTDQVFTVSHSGTVLEKSRKTYSLCGLCLHLKMGLRTFENWNIKNDDNPYTPILQMGKLKVMMIYSEAMQVSNPVAYIYLLKAMGMSDNPPSNYEPPESTITSPDWNKIEPVGENPGETRKQIQQLFDNLNGN